MKAEGRDIEVLGILIGIVTSVSHRKIPVSLFTPDARAMASASLDRVGCGRPVVVGYWPHALQKALVDLMPDFIFTPIVIRLAREEKEKELKRK